MCYVKKILIVEDFALISLSLEQLLENWGYDSEIATSGEEAISAAGAAKPDIVLMDVNIRGNINGVEAAGEIYSRFKIPSVLISGCSRNEECQNFPGVVEFLSKPVDVDRLKSVIAAVVNN